MVKVLVTGGAGYIGSHVCKALAERGDELVVFDNLSSGHRRAVQWGELIVGDIRDQEALAATLATVRPDAIMHFAAKIEVGEGERDPAGFWSVNVGGLACLSAAAIAANVNRLVFSSTCAIYGVPDVLPIGEGTPRVPVSVYGQTKDAAERLLEACDRAGTLRYAALRYFNACGASPDREIGEEHDPETHLIPNTLKAAAGLGGPLALFGDDYPTADGTCVRDYIHVSDLAAAHLAALDRLHSAESFACNLGTGSGLSVRQIIHAVERITGSPVPYETHSRRSGDVPILVADNSRAKELLGFEPKRSDLETIISDAWAFHSSRWQ